VTTNASLLTLWSTVITYVKAAARYVTYNHWKNTQIWSDGHSGLQPYTPEADSYTCTYGKVNWDATYWPVCTWLVINACLVRWTGGYDLKQTTALMLGCFIRMTTLLEYLDIFKGIKSLLSLTFCHNVLTNQNMPENCLNLLDNFFLMSRAQERIKEGQRKT